jgi:hypothetical protein
MKYQHLLLLLLSFKLLKEKIKKKILIKKIEKKEELSLI